MGLYCCFFVKEKQKAERRARMERIRKEKQEKEAVEGPEDEKEEDTGIPEGGDPFQTLDDHLTIKVTTHSGETDGRTDVSQPFPVIIIFLKMWLEGILFKFYFRRLKKS